MAKKKGFFGPTKVEDAVVISWPVKIKVGAKKRKKDYCKKEKEKIQERVPK